MATPSVTNLDPQAIEQKAPEGLDRAAVTRLSELKGEPQWLRESRIAGWEAFEDLPLPRWTKGIAQWWTTDVSEIRLADLKPYVAAGKSGDEAKGLVALADETENAGGLMVQINSEVAYSQIPDSLKAQGVIFSS